MIRQDASQGRQVDYGPRSRSVFEELSLSVPQVNVEDTGHQFVDPTIFGQRRTIILGEQCERSDNNFR